MKWLLLVACVAAHNILPPGGLERRTLSRFTKGHADNAKCWDRTGPDGFFTVVDGHNHFRPFGGPEVPMQTYLHWMQQHGILFSNVMGLGQRIQKSNPKDPDCCYYLHCPTTNYTVVPTTANDVDNANDLKTHYQTNTTAKSQVELILSATFPDLQDPINNLKNMKDLEAQFPGMFGWAGEINIFKHALAANGFWTKPRITLDRIEKGEYDDFFNYLSGKSWPVTLHCDLGCDNYLAIPGGLECSVPAAETKAAAQNFQWWKEMLGPHYSAFFDKASNQPLDNFDKVQHLQVWDTFLTRYSKLKVVWAHVGLSKELLRLHPTVHRYILKKLFDRHPNLHGDLSWDIIAQIFMMDYKNETIAEYLAKAHEDLTEDSESFFDSDAIDDLHKAFTKLWKESQGRLHVEEHGSSSKINGPTVDFAIYHGLIQNYSTRFLTGTDFVASYGSKETHPGLKAFKPVPTGCMKDPNNHARQLADTSSINLFLDEEAFRRIVLGGNFFRLTGLDSKYTPPPVCSLPPKKSTTNGVIVVNTAVLSALVAILCTSLLNLVATGF
jgi:hypothetical protein